MSCYNWSCTWPRTGPWCLPILFSDLQIQATSLWEIRELPPQDQEKVGKGCLCVCVSSYSSYVPVPVPVPLILTGCFWTERILHVIYCLYYRKPTCYCIESPEVRLTVPGAKEPSCWQGLPSDGQEAKRRSDSPGGALEAHHQLASSALGRQIKLHRL